MAEPAPRAAQPTARHLARNLASLRHARTLTPEPVPDETLEVMDFEPGAVMGGTPHLPGTRENGDALAAARGVSVVVFAKAGV